MTPRSCSSLVTQASTFSSSRPLLPLLLIPGAVRRRTRRPAFERVAGGTFHITDVGVGAEAGVGTGAGLEGLGHFHGVLLPPAVVMI